jgi:predicted small metal-binding protein
MALSYISIIQKGDEMAKTYTCRDVGVDCDWRTSGATEDEVMATISEHAAQVHPTIELTPDLVASVRGVIKDE